MPGGSAAAVSLGSVAGGSGGFLTARLLSRFLRSYKGRWLGCCLSTPPSAGRAALPRHCQLQYHLCMLLFIFLFCTSPAASGGISTQSGDFSPVER